MGTSVQNVFGLDYEPLNRKQNFSKGVVVKEAAPLLIFGAGLVQHLF
jgi:hypothetical protein